MPAIDSPSNRRWYVVGALFLAGAMVYGIGLYGFTLLVQPISAEYGWNHAQTGGLVSIFWLAAPLTPLGAYCNRRIGPGRLVVIAILVEAACLMAIPMIGSIIQLYVLRALMGVGKVALMVGLTGQCAAWFRRRFGLAIAICFAGWHFGGLVVAPCAEHLISDFGWRSACHTLSIAILVVALPPMLLWGCARPVTDKTAALASDPRPATRHASIPVFRRPAFWTVILVTMLGAFPYGAVIAHETRIVGELGFGPAISAWALGLTAGVALVATLVTGLIADRIPPDLLLIGEFAIMSLSCALFCLAFLHQSNVMMLAAATMFGAALGSFDTGIVAWLQKRFGNRDFNKLFGIWYFFYLAVLLVGPVEVGALSDKSGSFFFAIELLLASAFTGWLITLALWLFSRTSAKSPV